MSITRGVEAETGHHEPRGHLGPPPAVPAIAFVVLFVVSIVLSGILSSEPPPTPASDPEDIGRYFSTNQLVATLNAFFQFVAALALGVFSASVLSRFTFLRPNVAGPVIAALGGVVSACLLAVNALVQWVLGQPGIAEDENVVRALQLLFFAAGGPGHTAALGILIMGLAVTALLGRLMPRWLAVAGLVIAAVALLSSLTLLVDQLAVLLPIGRFGGMLWLLVAAFRIPRTRPAVGG